MMHGTFEVSGSSEFWEKTQNCTEKRRYRRVTWWQILRTAKSKITRIYVTKVKKTNSRHIVKTNRIKSVKKNIWNEGKGKIKF